MEKSSKIGISQVHSNSYATNLTRNKITQSIILSVAVFLFLLFSVLIYTQQQSNKQEILALSAITPTSVPSTDPLHPVKPYYGVNVDMSQLVPGSSNYYKNSKGQDYIDIAHSLGITLFRITNIIQGYQFSGNYQLFTQSQWNSVLNKMKTDNIKAVILIESPSPDQNLFSPELNQSYINLVQQYALDSNVGNNSDVIGIDIKNEPTLDANNLSYLKQARNMIKQKYPQMPLCVGGWRTNGGQKDSYGNPIFYYHVPEDAPKLDSIVDFYCVHLYGFDLPNSAGILQDPTNRAASFLEAMALHSNNKPILVEEFGASNGTTITDQKSLGSPKIQANAYAGVYQAILNNYQNLHLMGSTSYLFSPRGVSPDSWAIMSKDGNTLYPAAYTLQKYSTGNTGVAQAQNISTTAQPHIFTNKNKGSMQTVNAGDPVGFILNLPKSTQYKATMSVSRLTTQTEPLTYDSSHNTYNTVYQTNTKGTVVFTVFNNSSCTPQNPACSKNVVYIMVLKIQ